ncbi:MAG: PQQ-like beta-propeller repeat protein [Oscillospiraceae bacterium]|nr:PQQ-like beta-propeller repeat protein [Oscillospiraceae bacterium]
MEQQPRRLTRKELLRRNKKIAKRRQMRLTIIAVAVTAVLVHITGLYGASLAYLGDFVSSGMVYMQFGAGFPAQVENQTYKQSEKMGSSLCVLDADSLSFYSPTADKVYEYYHSMQNPVISASEKRVAVYNSNDTSLKILNAHDVLFSHEMENDIIHASLAHNNYAAVTTKSQSYNGEVKVFDSQMQEVFTWLNAKSFPVQSFLSPKAAHLAVSCVLTVDGRLQSHIYIIDTETGEEKFVLENSDAVALGIEFIREDTLIVFYTDKATAINIEDGSVKGQYSYNGADLTAYDIKNAQVVMALGDYDGFSTSELVLCDLSLEKVLDIDTQQAVTAVKMTNQRIFALGSEKISQYTLKGEFAGETAAKNNVKDIADYNGCIVINGDSLEKLEKADIK